MDSVVQRYKRKKSGDNVDWISKLPDDVLLLILSELPTEEAIRTSVASKRWEHVWKKLPHLVLNTRRRFNNPDAELTRVINNHYGDLESCAITHSSHECVHGLLNTWIHSLIWMKHTKNLTLDNYTMYQPPNLPSSCFPRCSLSLPSLMSLSLNSYYLTSSRPFINCSNIKILKLLYIYSPEIGVFNNILAFCPSLEVLVLNIECTDTRPKRFTLKIENSKLKFLEMSSIIGIDKVIVSSPCLDILVSKNTYLMGREFLVHSPNLQFSETAVGLRWTTTLLYIIYNISEEKNSGHEELVNRIGEFDFLTEIGATLSVAVDLMNQTEVERLHQVLCLWSNFNDSRGIEIKLKGNNVPSSSEEIECWQKKLWVENDHEYSLPNAKSRVNFVLIYNFKGSKEEIAFVSCLIRQGKVKRRIILHPKSFSTSHGSNIEAAVAKLQEVQSEDHQKVPEIELIRNL